MPLLRSWVNHPMEYESGSMLRRPGIPISARTTGEVLGETSRILGVRFEPHNGPMWFRMYGIPDYGDRYMLTDISVKRGGTMIYPMRPIRDTNFAIQDSDTVSVFIITD
jgi:hypothetical protein